VIAHGTPFKHLFLQVLNIRLDGVTLDKSTSGFKTGIEVKGCHEGLHAIGKQGRLFAATTTLFSFTHAHIPPQPELCTDVTQVLTANQGCAEACQFSLLKLRKPTEERFTDQKPNHRISKKFKLLIVLVKLCGRLPGQMLFMCQRTMGEGLDEEVLLPEAVSERAFERFK
jgi:hypothetical protein